MATQNPVPSASEGSLSARLRTLVAVFLKLGAIAFGGPASAIAMMENEIVRKQGGITRQQFLDILGLTNLIPGPSSTEIAICIGFTRAGWVSLVVAGASFILPAAMITTAARVGLCSIWNVTRRGVVAAGSEAGGDFCYSTRSLAPGKIAVRDSFLGGLGALGVLAFLAKVNPLLILVIGGSVGMWRSKCASPENRPQFPDSQLE